MKRGLIIEAMPKKGRPGAWYVTAAEEAIKVNCKYQGDNIVPVVIYDEHVIDLLTNVRHYCAANGFDYDSIDSISAGHYDVEKLNG